MNDFLDLLQKGLQELDLYSDEAKIQKIDTFSNLLLKWNKTFNLTSINKKEEVATKHILDSLSVVKYLKEYCPSGGTVLDAGSGAGLPGIPLAIFCPEFEFTLIDAVRKKVSFQIQAVGMLGLKNVHPLHMRLESKQLKGGFDVILSRAFASLNDFAKITAHLTDKGYWLALKANLSEEEIAGLSKEFSIERIIRLNVPFLSETRNLVVLQKMYPVMSSRSKAQNTF